MNFKNSLIAIATDDSETASSYFGQTRFYEVTADLLSSKAEPVRVSGVYFVPKT